jgi:hypothetical protein
MIKRVLIIFIVCLMIGTISGRINAQPVPRQSGTSTGAFNITIGTGNTVVMSYDGRRFGWMLHPENGNIRCVLGNNSGDPINDAATTTHGIELTSGGYYNNSPGTNSTEEVDCASETGTVKISGIMDVY